MSGPVLLFVYGSLRSGTGHLMAERLASQATYVGDASVAGTLYDTGPFPACLPPEAPDDRVQGDLWAIPEQQADELLLMLDRYEGFAPDARYGSLFLRQRVPVRFGDGSEQEAWMYRYNQPPQAAQRVSSGDWLNR